MEHDNFYYLYRLTPSVHEIDKSTNFNDLKRTAVLLAQANPSRRYVVLRKAFHVLYEYKVESQKVISSQFELFDPGLEELLKHSA